MNINSDQIKKNINNGINASNIPYDGSTNIFDKINNLSSDDIPNESGISGTTVTDALDALNGTTHDHNSEKITLSSTVTSGQTIGTLSSATSDISTVELYLNGQALLNYEIDNTDGQFKVESDKVTLTWLDTTFDLDSTDILVVYSDKNNTGTVHRHKSEVLSVTSLNVISNLSFAPSSNSAVKLIVNGLDTLNDAIDTGNGFFSVSGKSITWNSTNAGYDVDTTDKIIARYYYI